MFWASSGLPDPVANTSPVSSYSVALNLFLQLARPVRSEGSYGPLRESYPAAGSVLRFGEFERTGLIPVSADPLQLTHDVQRSGVEVYVRPPERQRLALPEPAQQAYSTLS